MYLSIICIPRTKCDLRFFIQFLAGLLGFLLETYIHFFYVLDINHLLDMWFANIFSHSIGCFFLLLMGFVAEKKLFSLMQSYLFIIFYFFLLPLLWCQVQKNFAKKFNSMFSSKSFMIWGALFSYLILFELTFLYHVRQNPILFFHIWLISFHSAIYQRDYPFLIIYSWLLC